MTDITQPPQDDVQNLAFDYDPQGVINLAFKTSLLTFITLGIYRFWAKTKIRQRLWGSLRIDGDPLEYTGTGLEKFLGFLVAIVILAIYLGFVNLGLTFLGFTLFFEAETEEEQLIQFAFLMINIIAVLPLLLFAQYRARRYRMARTRWRGIRAGMDVGAWGFVIRALGMSILNTITLGLLSPWRRFKLEKYMTDRTYFGSQVMVQNGRWTQMYGAMKWVLIAYACLIVAGVCAVLEAEGLAIFLGVVGCFLVYAGMLYYLVRTEIYLMSHKTLGDARVELIDATPTAPQHVTAANGSTFKVKERPLHRKIFWRIVGGYLGASLLGGLGMALVAGVGFGVGKLFDNELVALVLGVLGYMLGFAFIEALMLVLVTFPVAQLYVTHMRLFGFSSVLTISQREADSGADAEGFADALDIGGAF